MTKSEIVRRLRALIALPVKARPISITVLEELAALHKRAIYEIVETRAMSERTRIRLERALVWIENDQVRYTAKKNFVPNQERDVKIEEPKPPCLTVQIIRFTDKGPRIKQVAYNPNAFPEKEGQP